MAELLSTQSLILFTSAFGLMCSVLVIIHGGATRTMPGIVLGIGLLLMTLGTGLLLLRIQGDTILGMYAANSALIIGWAFFDRAYHRMLMEHPSPWPPIIMTGITLTSFLVLSQIRTGFAIRSFPLNAAVTFTLFRVGVLSGHMYENGGVFRLRLFSRVWYVLGFFMIARTIVSFAIPQTTVGIDQTWLNIFTFMAETFLLAFSMATYFLIQLQKQNLFQEEARTKSEIYLVVQKYLNKLMTHDLYSPMGSLHNLLADVIEKAESNQPIDSNVIHVMHEVSGKSLLLLANISDMGKYFFSRNLPPPSATMPNQIIEAAIHEFEDDVRAKSLQFECDLGQEIVVTVDSHGLTSLVRNMIHEAVRNSPNEGVIRMRLNLKANSVLVFTVRDTGPCLSDAENAVFTRELLSGAWHSDPDKSYIRRDAKRHLSFMVMSAVCHQLGWDISFRSPPPGEPVPSDGVWPSYGSISELILSPEE